LRARRHAGSIVSIYDPVTRGAIEQNAAAGFTEAAMSVRSHHQFRRPANILLLLTLVVPLYGDDVLAVLDALKLQRPVLVGHSIGGQELSSVATRHPARVAALVYLEAGYPYAFDNGTGPTLNEMQGLRSPQPPPPGDADLASFMALRQYFLRVQGFAVPEAELRQQRPVGPDGRVGKPRDFPGYSTLLAGMKKYFDIRVPALVFFALPHGLGRWVDDSADPKVGAEAQAYSSALTRLTTRQAQLIEDGVRTARVVKLPGAHHYIHLSNQADVIREMRSFLDRVR